MIASSEDQIKAKEDAKKATDEAREAEKKFRDSIRGFGIEGTGRGIEAMARIQESRNLRAAGRDNPIAKTPVLAVSPALKSNKSNVIFGASAPGGDGIAQQIQILERIAKNTEEPPIQIKSAGIGN